MRSLRRRVGGVPPGAEIDGAGGGSSVRRGPYERERASQEVRAHGGGEAEASMRRWWHQSHTFHNPSRTPLAQPSMNAFIYACIQSRADALTNLPLPGKVASAKAGCGRSGNEAGNHTCQPSSVRDRWRVFRVTANIIVCCLDQLVSIRPPE